MGGGLWLSPSTPILGNYLTGLSLKGYISPLIKYFKVGGKIMNEKKDYSIGAASKITGISIKQIRYWQSKGYIDDQNRVVCGKRSFRYFSDADIKHIKAINLLMQRGYTLAFASKLAGE
jgi:hypothetical protein